MITIEEKIAETRKYISDRIATKVPAILLILGSGFGGVAAKSSRKIRLSYGTIPHFNITSAPTHAGSLIFGVIAGKDLMIMDGRLHVYEGYEVAQTVYPVHVAAALGVKTLISTNLSGGINKNFKIGDFMVVNGHINASGLDLYGKKNITGDMKIYKPYTPELIQLLEKISCESHMPLQKGILAYLTGPSFETRAELKMLKMLGADAVGWSMAPELLVALSYDMDVLGIACISDISNPDNLSPVKLDTLYQAGFEKADSLFFLLRRLISKL